MAFAYLGAGALDYSPCRYGKSKLLFRGPRRSLNRQFIAAMGGTETYGKFVAEPWPALLEARLHMPVVNFGCMNAGIDVFANEPHVLEASGRAAASIIQVLGAANMSNPYYAVHPRRNDRFLRASNLMRRAFPEIDFTEIHFTRHLLTVLKAQMPERFDTLAAELQDLWGTRMRHFLHGLKGDKVLLWLGNYHAPGHDDPLGNEPVLVTTAMVQELEPLCAAVVRVDPSMSARSAGTIGMSYGPFEEPAAQTMPGPMVQAEIAEALAPVMARFL